MSLSIRAKISRKRQITLSDRLYYAVQPTMSTQPAPEGLDAHPGQPECPLQSQPQTSVTSLTRPSRPKVTVKEKCCGVSECLSQCIDLILACGSSLRTCEEKGV
jgi:hypothetical protein